MTNANERRVNRTAQNMGYRLDKVGKGSHRGQFYIVNVAEGARIASDRMFLVPSTPSLFKKLKTGWPSANHQCSCLNCDLRSVATRQRSTPERPRPRGSVYESAAARQRRASKGPAKQSGS